MVVNISYDDYWANKILGELDENVEYNIVQPKPKENTISENDKKVLNTFEAFLKEKNKDIRRINIVQKRKEDVEVGFGNIRTVEVNETIEVLNKKATTMYDIWDAQLKRL